MNRCSLSSAIGSCKPMRNEEPLIPTRIPWIKRKGRTGAMAQMVKVLATQSQHLEFDAQMVRTYSPNPGWWRQEDLWGWLVNQLAWLANSRPRERLCLKKKKPRWMAAKEDDLWTPHMPTCMHAHVHVHTHMDRDLDTDMDWKQCSALETQVYCGYRCKMKGPFWGKKNTTVWQFLKSSAQACSMTKQPYS